MLPKLLSEKIKEQGLSYREVATQIGISHMTVARVLRGDSVDLDTLDAIARWLGVPLATILDARNAGSDEGFMGEVQLLSGMNPEFREVFQELFAQISNGDIDPRVLGDIVAYAQFRIHQGEQGRNNVAHNAEPQGGDDRLLPED